MLPEALIMEDSGLYNSDSDASSLPATLVSEQQSLDGFEDSQTEQAVSGEFANSASQHTQTATQAAKAMEAAEDRDSTFESEHNIAESFHRQRSSLTQQAIWPNDEPILDAGPAPPDYFAATSWRRSAPVNPSRPSLEGSPALESQETTENVARDNETLHSRRPGSDSDFEQGNIISEDGDEDRPIDETPTDETMPLLRRFRGSMKASSRSRYRRKLLLFAVAVAAIALVITVLLLGEDSSSAIRHHPDVHGDPALDHPATDNCIFNSYSDYVEFSYTNPSFLGILDHVDFRDDPDLELRTTIISGNVEVLYLPWNSSIVADAAIVIRVHMATTLPWKVQVVRDRTIFQQNYGLAIKNPILQKSDAHGLHLNVHPLDIKPCLDVFVVVYVREGTVLERWISDLNSLNFIDHEAASRSRKKGVSRSEDRKEKFFVANSTEIFAKKGNINLNFWISNDTKLFADIGLIQGTYGLHRKLNITTIDGDIDVLIDTRPSADHTFDKPLNISRYHQEVLTESVRGHTQINLLSISASEDFAYPGYQWSKDIASHHHSYSGFVDLTYPPEWSGDIFGRPGQGIITLSGDDIEVIPDDGDQVVRARKGHGNDRLDLQTSLGKVTLYIG